MSGFAGGFGPPDQGMRGTTEVGRMGDVADTQRAARWAAQGYVIGTYLDGVDAIWVDAHHPDAAVKIQAIKGEKRQGKPLSTALEAADLVPLLDAERIPPALHGIFLDPAELDGRLGALSALRVPVQPAAARRLPDFMTSRSDEGVFWLQNWLPAGHEAGVLLVHELKKVGVDLPAVTSMNVSGRPEIADQEEALAFSQEHGVRMLLNDPHPKSGIRGSYPILAIGPDGVVLFREGHFPGELFRDLLDYDEIDFSQVKPARYPIGLQVREQFAGHQLHARALRKALLGVIHQSS
jgi:tRNA A37 threonylcarbamoyladenosine synthetase subunit TsaC/SUA5/YrdC